MKCLLLALTLAVLALPAYAADARIGWQCATDQNSNCNVSDTWPLPSSNQGSTSAAITPADATNLTGGATRAIFNGNATACNINMKLKGDTTAVIWKNVQSGQILPVKVLQVYSTSTTCTDLVAIYGE